MVLIEKYNMTQVDVARKLGITQPAISYYLHSKRGRQAIDFLKNNKKIMALVESIADKIYYEKDTEKIYEDFCNLCLTIRKDEELVKFVQKNLFKKY